MSYVDSTYPYDCNLNYLYTFTPIRLICYLSYRMANFIKSAIKHPGAFKAEAKSAGMSTNKFAQKEKHAKGVLGRRARLALTLSKMRKKKR